jgi:hypothetical protein
MAGKDEANGQHHTVETDTNLSETTPAIPATETKAKTADTNESAACIAWDDAVAEGKAILAKVAQAERSPYRLGELAHKVVHPKYGEEQMPEYPPGFFDATEMPIAGWFANR